MKRLIFTIRESNCQRYGLFNYKIYENNIMFTVSNFFFFFLKCFPIKNYNKSSSINLLNRNPILEILKNKLYDIILEVF